MHFRPEELRAVRRGDLVVRYAPFGDVTFALATLPEDGTSGTSLAQPCVQPHWGLVLQGSVALHRDGRRRRLAAGSAFYVESGEPAHRFVSRSRAVLAGFVPSTPGTRRQSDFQPLSAPGAPALLGRVAVNTIAGTRRIRARDGEVRTDAGLMGPWLFVQASFGGTSGFTSGWCDLPHWGIVLQGGLTIEWEDDVEALGAGDVYFCPAGGPGHRFEVADEAVIFDFTPLEAIAEDRRVEAWRPVLREGRIRAQGRRSRTRPTGRAA